LVGLITGIGADFDRLVIYKKDLGEVVLWPADRVIEWAKQSDGFWAVCGPIGSLI